MDSAAGLSSRPKAALLSLGPPDPLAAVPFEHHRVYTGLAVTGDERTIGTSMYSQVGAFLLDSARPWRRTLLTPHTNVADLALSADGHWACSASRGESADRRLVKIWDVSTGKLVMALPLGNARVAFSPDSKWLGVGGQTACRFFRTGTWAAGPVLDYGADVGQVPLAFHPSSRVAALFDSTRSIVRLVDVKTGNVLASLDAPDQSTAYHLVWSPDGRYLAVPQSDQRVDLWDLSSIRRRLDQLGLAKGIPDVFGDPDQHQPPRRVDRIDVRGADAFGLTILAARHALSRGWWNFRLFFEPNLTDPFALQVRAECWQRFGQWRLAIADSRASLAILPDSAVAANDLAWTMVAAPNRANAEEAVAWARRAAEIEPEWPSFQNTLGAALYRGRFPEAVAVLERNIPQNPADVGLDLIFLAMCRQRMGQPAAARAAMAGARNWRTRATGLNPAASAEFEILC